MPDRAMLHQKALYSFSLMFLLGFTAPALGQTPAEQQVQTLYQQATQAYQKGEMEQAWQLAQQAIAIAKANNQDRYAFQILLEIANQQRKHQQFQAALQSYQQAWELLQKPVTEPKAQIEQQQWQGIILRHLAQTHQALQQFPQAIAYDQKAVAIWQKLGDRQTVASLWLELGLLQQKNQNFPAASQYYQAALELATTLNLYEIRSSALNSLAFVQEHLGQIEPAKANYEKLQQLSASQKDLETEAYALSSLADLSQRSAQFDRAEAQYQQALSRFRQIKSTEYEALTLVDLGNLAIEQQQFDRAETFYQEALALQQGAGQRSFRGTTLLNLGRLAKLRQQNKVALNYYEQAQTIFQEVNNVVGIINITNNIASIYSAQGDWPKAEALFQKALTQARQIKRRDLEDAPLNNLGDLAGERGQYSQALNYHESALAIYREFQNQRGEARSLNNIGTVYINLNQLDSAIAHLEAALKIARSRQDADIEATTLNNLGYVYDLQGKTDLAFQTLETALKIRQTLNDRSGIGSTLTNLASAYERQGYLDWAFSRYQEALQIFTALGEKANMARGLTNLGSVLQNQSEFEQSHQQYQKALAIAREISDRDQEERILNNLGNLAVSTSEYAKALSLLEQSLSMTRELKNPSSELRVLNNLGSVYNALGRTTKAIDYLQQSLTIAKSLNLPGDIRTALNNLGYSHILIKDFDKAESLFQESLKISRQLKEPESEAIALNNLGRVHEEHDQYPQAINTYQQALKIVQTLKQPRYEATVLNNIGLAQQEIHNFDASIRNLQQALKIRRTIADRASTAIVLNNLGRALVLTKQPAQAEPLLREAIGIWESLRPGLTDENKITLFENISTTYRLLQRALIDQGKPNDALEIAERGRARTFVELLATRFGRESQQAQQAFLQQTIATAPNLTEIRQIAQQQQATLVQYSIFESQQQKRLFIWVIQPNGNIIFKEVNLETQFPHLTAKDSPLKQLVSRSRSTIGVRSRGIQINRAQITSAKIQGDLKQLHQILIDPIAAHLPQDPQQRVIFIPQGELFLVPFAALQDAQNRFLIEKHTLVTAPAIQVLNLTPNTNQGSGALIVGDPIMPKLEDMKLAPLPGARAEAIAIGQLLNTPPLLGAEATKKAVLSRMTQAQTIHFATHGLLDTFSGEVPGAIALAPQGKDNGLLTASEIFDLRLKANLVVLSACDTGRGDITGDGVIGLSRTFMAAGTPSIIVSLWQVPDEPTKLLMTEFYRQLRSSGGASIDKAQALRQATLRTLKQYPNIADWAGFLLIGQAQD